MGENVNKKLGKKIAKEFNKKYGIITYSGTLAIEVALSSLKLKKGSKVLVLSEVCYSIVNTILKLELIPVIVTSKNGLYLTTDDIDEALNKQDIDCLLLVHQYGIFNNVDLRKYKTKGIKIIEDVAQAWGIGNKEYIIGEFSDIVVTSFGKTKPLSYGIGGGLFFNDNNILEKIDFCDNISREKTNLLLAYAYPLCNEIDYNKLKLLADKIVEEQRDNANKYSNILRNQQKIKYLDSDLYSGNVWHRFPIWVEDKALYKKIVDLLEKTELEYQLPHEIELIDLPLCENCIKVSNSSNTTNQILLRTRNVNIDKQLNIIEKILKIC